jgi:HK97 family phage portal protein
MLSGNAYVYAPRDPETLEPLMVKVLHPESVTITRTNGKLQYIVRNSDQVEGSVYGPETILHIPLIRLPGADYGLSPLDALRNTFALGLTVEEYAQRFFATGSTPTGVIEVADSSLTPDQVKAIKEGWIRHHTGANMHTPGVLVGATFKALSFRPEDAQLLGSREFTVNEIARIYRVPPALLAVTTPGAMSYGSVEQLSEDFVRFTLRPLAELIERALSTLIPLPEAFVKLNMDALLRGSTEARYNAYAKGLASGWLSVAEIRRSEDLSPIEDSSADAYRQPLNESDAAIASARQKADVFAILIGAGMTPEEAKKLAGL